MAKNWWFKFDFRVWRNDSELQQCSLEARGFWLEMLCVMYEQETFQVSGSVQQIARLARCDSSDVSRISLELKNANVCDVTLGNGNVTLLSRRMKREVSIRESNRLRVMKHRCNGDVTAQSNKKEVKSKKKEEKKEENGANAPVSILFEFWKETMTLNGATKLTKKRRDKIQARLREGYTIERIQNAIRGCKASPFHSGQNDNRTIYNDIELICRSGEKVEFFENIWTSNQPTPIDEQERLGREAVKRGQDEFYAMLNSQRRV